jgi:hypothetical protein
MRRHFLIVTLVALGATLLIPQSGFAQTPNNIRTDAYNNQGSSYFSDIVKPNAILPDIVYPYLPSGAYWNNLGAGDIQNAPAVGAVEAIITFLAKTFEGKASDTGLWMWRICMTLTYMGLLLTGFLTWQSVTTGKKPFNEGFVGYVTKVIVAVALLTYVVPNVPPMLIGISNIITSTLSNWFVGTANNQDTKTLRAMWGAKMGAGQAAAGAMISTMTNAANGALDKAQAEALIKAVMDDEEVKKVMDPAKWDPQWQEVLAKYNNLGQAAGIGTNPASMRELNTFMSGVAGRMPSIVHERITAHAESILGNSTNTGDSEVKKQIAMSTRGLDFTELGYPARAIQIYAYIAFSYLGIAIWGMGYGAMVWVMLYSMPEEWNMGGALFSGVKGGIGIILGVVLVAIYVSSGVNWTDVESAKNAAEAKSLVYDVLLPAAKILAGGASGLIADASTAIASVVADPGGMVMKLFSLWTGITPEQFIIGMLILTAPMQAAMIVKGANGIAEHANKAMHSNTASSQGVAGAFGMQGGSSGANVAGTGGDVRGIMLDRSAMAPSRT